MAQRVDQCDCTVRHSVTPVCCTMIANPRSELCKKPHLGVGSSVGMRSARSDGASVGVSDGATVGATLGTADGIRVGNEDG